jgi:acetyl-CoA carboxylase biotin carboxyl carrier protein
VSAASPASGAPAAADDEANITYITSPMVGTFYTASSPDAPAFVNVGDRVIPETPVCILEAMKVFNEIPAECSGSILERLVENGDAIEFGQNLFKVQTS